MNDDDEKFFELMDGMEMVNRDMDKQINAAAPMCHFKKMNYEEGESGETWFECSVCGNTRQGFKIIRGEA